MVNGAKYWSFTTNNYGDDDTFASLPEGSLHLVVGREVSDSGTPHLQGAIALSRPRTLGWLRRNVSQFRHCHLSVSRNPSAAVVYCKKGGDYDEFGTWPNRCNQGKRNDLEAFKESVCGGEFDLDNLREQHSLVFAKYPRFVIDYISQHKPVEAPTEHPLFEWQQNLRSILDEDPGDRQIIFIVDFQGNSGKSWFADWYAHHFPNTQVLLPGKKADMAFALKENNRVLFIDAPRSKQGEFIQYDILEEIKNRRIFSGKYESRIKTLSRCHVIVLMNETPEMTKLSPDRYHIIEVQNDLILN